MAAKRKKWKVTYRQGDGVQERKATSESGAYRVVHELVAGTSIAEATVWVDEGNGRWLRYEDVDLNEWRAVAQAEGEPT